MARYRLLFVSAWIFGLSSVVAVAQGGIHGYVAAWDFDEGQGAVLHDRSTSHLDGQIIGAQWITGKAGSGLHFDGVNDYVDLAPTGVSPLIGSLAQGSIAMWFRFDAVPLAGRIHSLLYLGDGIGGPTNRSLIVEIGHFGVDTKLYFTILDGTGLPIQCFDSSIQLQPNAWYHFVAVVSATANTGYLDGVEMTGRYYNFGNAMSHWFFQAVPGQQAFWLGRGKLGFNVADQWLQGTLDGLRIFDRALTATEAQQLHAMGSHRYPGTMEDFVLATGLDGAACTTGGMDDVKIAGRGQMLTVQLGTPGQGMVGAPLLLVADVAPYGAVAPDPYFPALWVRWPNVLVIVDGTVPMPGGNPFVLNAAGLTLAAQIPVGFPPHSLVLQAAAVTPAASAGAALSEAHEIRIY